MRALVRIHLRDVPVATPTALSRLRKSRPEMYSQVSRITSQVTELPYVEAAACFPRKSLEELSGVWITAPGSCCAQIRPRSIRKWEGEVRKKLTSTCGSWDT